MKTRAHLLRMNADQLDEYVLSLCEEGYERHIDYERGNWHESGHWELRFWNGENGYTLEFGDKGELVDYIIKYLQKDT